MDVAETGKFVRTRQRLGRWNREIDAVGARIVFYGKAILQIPGAVARHPGETLRLVAEISMGSGALAMIGDPGRSYLPKSALTHVIDYNVPVTRELEDSEIKRTAVWRV